jgi:hypothetical protein
MNADKRALVGCILALAAGITPQIISAPAHADDSAIVANFAAALTDASLAESLQGNASAFEQVSTLLALPEPWRSLVIGRIESSDFLTNLAAADMHLSPAELHAFERFKTSLGEAQGSKTWPTAQILAFHAGEFTVDFSEHDTNWVVVDGTASAASELFIRSDSCTPEVAVFPNLRQLPSRPADVAARYASDIVSLPTQARIAIRLRRNDCPTQKISFTTEWGEPRRRIFAEDTQTIVVAANQVCIVSLSPSHPRSFNVQTEGGYLYDVFAAPLSSDTDPALMHPDRSDPAKPDMVDDDGGWELGSRLSSILGTGDLEKFAVISAKDGGGEVALYMEQRPVPIYDPESHQLIEVGAKTPQWVRLHVPEGRWRVKTTHLSTGFDPALVIHGGEHLDVLGENDDVKEGDPAAEVSLTLQAPGDLFVEIMSVNHESGTVQLSLTRVTRKAFKRTSSHCCAT